MVLRQDVIAYINGRKVWMLTIAQSSKIYFNVIKKEHIQKKRTVRRGRGRKERSTLGFCMHIGYCISGPQFVALFF